mmetsp:Transcript_26104/g.69475  ORF Transcript_26104/g.69475 Transcript_26104/m.69475 type:complete len:236 (-) Transcript_26104:800-1507(-)
MVRGRQGRRPLRGRARMERGVPQRRRGLDGGAGAGQLDHRRGQEGRGCHLVREESGGDRADRVRDGVVLRGEIPGRDGPEGARDPGRPGQGHGGHDLGQVLAQGQPDRRQGRAGHRRQRQGRGVRRPVRRGRWQASRGAHHLDQGGGPRPGRGGQVLGRAQHGRVRRGRRRSGHRRERGVPGALQGRDRQQGRPCDPLGHRAGAHHPAGRGVGAAQPGRVQKRREGVDRRGRRDR